MFQYLRRYLQFNSRNCAKTRFVTLIKQIVMRITKNIDNVVLFQQNRMNNFDMKINLKKKTKHEILIIFNFFFPSFSNSLQNTIENVFLRERKFVTTICFMRKFNFSSFLKKFADENKIIFRVIMIFLYFYISKKKFESINKT